MREREKREGIKQSNVIVTYINLHSTLVQKSLKKKKINVPIFHFTSFSHPLVLCYDPGQICPLPTALNQNWLHHLKLSLQPMKGWRSESPLDMKTYLNKTNFFSQKKLVLLLKFFKNKFLDLKKKKNLSSSNLPFFLMTKGFFLEKI